MNTKNIIGLIIIPILILSSFYLMFYVPYQKQIACLKAENIRWHGLAEEDISHRSLDTPIEENIEQVRWHIEDKNELQKVEEIYERYLSLKEVGGLESQNKVI